MVLRLAVPALFNMSGRTDLPDRGVTDRTGINLEDDDGRSNGG